MIDYPGAYSTYLYGINDNGAIVGVYQDSADHSKYVGFVATPIPSVPPVANAGPDQVVLVEDGATLDGSDSSDPDPDGSIVSYLWDADLTGDGTFETPIGNGAIVDLAPEIVEVINGKITEIQLTVRDNTDLSDTDTMLLAVAGPCEAPPYPDEDGDGESDYTDLCPNTPAGEEVDANGCSLAEYCTAIDASTPEGRKICDRSDWKNDEPLNNKGNCDAIKVDESSTSYLCMPR